MLQAVVVSRREPQTYAVAAPAKINLALRVTGRRADGLHELDTVFIPLELADTVTVTVATREAAGPEAAAVRCSCPAHPELDGAENLAAAAAGRYLERAGLAHAVTVALTIDKRIWVAAGLGGGSSDAAAVLRVLQLHFGALDAEELAALALDLGADVPFFLDPRVARGRGVGEDLVPLDGIPALDLVLLNPGRSLATRDVFAALGLAPGQRRAGTLDEAIVALDGSVAGAARLVHNDLLPAALQLCPEIADLLRALRGRGALAAGMTGSGPTVFGVFEEPCRDLSREAVSTQGVTSPPPIATQGSADVRGA